MLLSQRLQTNFEQGLIDNGSSYQGLRLVDQKGCGANRDQPVAIAVNAGLLHVKNKFFE